MKRLRGKNKGQHLKPVQYANDWIMGTDEAGGSHIVSPLAVQLDPEDRAMFTRPSTEVAEVIHCGKFWRWYELDDEGRFRRRNVPTPNPNVQEEAASEARSYRSLV